MAYYPQDIIDQLRLNSDIVSLINEDTVLKGRGDRYTGLCPFPEHNEKTPSFSVSSAKQVYYCFGCQNSGNIFTYLEKQKGMDFKTAIEYLARKKGISLPKANPAYKKVAKQKSSFFNLTEKIATFYQKKLQESPADHPIRLYLKKRGWSKQTIQNFRLAYAPKKNVLLSFLKSPQEQKEAQELGLLNSSSSTGVPYDNFRHRLIFPIVSTNKQVVGFGARVLDDSLPKYINSKESKIFHKRQIFYGLNESARYLRQDSVALLVEGYTDFLSLWESGFKNTVATLGTALTEQHARLLKQYVGSVVLVFDADTAGLQASQRSLPLLLKAGLKVKFLSLPKSYDPDSFIKSQGIPAFKKLLEESQDLFLFLLNQKWKQKPDPLVLIEELSPILSGVPDKYLKSLYKQRLLDRFGTDRYSLEKLLNQSLKSPKVPSPAKKEEEILQSRKPRLALALPAERLLLVLCLQSEDLLKEFLDKKGLSYLKSSTAIKIFKQIADEYNEKPLDFKHLIHRVMAEVEDIQLLFKSSYPHFRQNSLENDQSLFEDCMDSLDKKQKQWEAGQLSADIKMKGQEDLKIQNLEKIYQLTKQRLSKKKKQKVDLENNHR